MPETVMIVLGGFGRPVQARVTQQLPDGQLKVVTESVYTFNQRPTNVFVVEPIAAYRVVEAL